MRGGRRTPGERSERMMWNEPANKAARTALSVGTIKTRNALLGAFLLEKIYPQQSVIRNKKRKKRRNPDALF